MAVFELKSGNTRPILQVTLRNPDGSPADHAGATGRKLNIHLADGTKLRRDLVPVGDAPGVGQPDNRPLRYVWTPEDWGPVNGDGTAGGLVVGPSLPLAPGEREHRMDYDVIAGTDVQTYPNGGTSPEEAFDTLRIWGAIYGTPLP